MYSGLVPEPGFGHPTDALEALGDGVDLVKHAGDLHRAVWQGWEVGGTPIGHEAHKDEKRNEGLNPRSVRRGIQGHSDHPRTGVHPEARGWLLLYWCAAAPPWGVHRLKVGPTRGTGT